MSHQLIRRLAELRAEYEAARAVLVLALRTWTQVAAEQELKGITHAAVQLSVANLEATYLIRLFALFEALLRDHWTASRPGTRAPDSAAVLIDQLGARYRIPAQVRSRTHSARQYRNAVAHARPGPPPVAFADALSSLNRYLAWLPD
jgi:hypothetical protein